MISSLIIPTTREERVNISQTIPAKEPTKTSYISQLEEVTRVEVLTIVVFLFPYEKDVITFAIIIRRLFNPSQVKIPKRAKNILNVNAEKMCFSLFAPVLRK